MLQCSSKATWYPHTCCSLKFLVWRSHHVFNIWTCTRYICDRIRQIVGCVYQRMLHSFWINFWWTLIIIVYTRWTYEQCLCNRSLSWFSYWKTTHVQLCAVSHSLSFGVENGFFIGDWISINLFEFDLSVGWKLVRKYVSY